MYKNWENGVKLPISTKYAVEKWHGATALAARASCARLCSTLAWANRGHARWPVARFGETAPGQRAWDKSGDL